MERQIKKIILKYIKENRKRNKLSEVGCFQSLHEAFRGNPGIVVKEYHAKSYVKFSVRDHNFKKIKKNGKCELSDLVLVSFSSKKKHRAKITFLQAKITKNAIPHNVRHLHKYSVDHTQWDLLHNRPPIRPTGQIKNKVPSTILSNAVFRSIGSYGFFIPENNGRDAGFCFFSSDILRPVKPINGKTGRVALLNQKKWKQYPDETVYCCCLSIFLEELFQGRIGSPIQSQDQNKFIGSLIKSIENDDISSEEKATLDNLRDQLVFNNQESKKVNMRFIIVDTSQYREKETPHTLAII